MALTRPDVSPGRSVRQARSGTCGLALAQAGSLQFEAVRAVDDAIQDGIADRRIPDDIVPTCHGDLAGDQQRALFVAVVDDFQQVASLLGAQRGTVNLLD